MFLMRAIAAAFDYCEPAMNDVFISQTVEQPYTRCSKTVEQPFHFSLILNTLQAYLL